MAAILKQHYIEYTGYSALFRHPNNELNYCVYIIPGNPQVTNETLPYWHEQLTKEDKNISKALGSGAKLERMKAGNIKFLFIGYLFVCLFVCLFKISTFDCVR